MRGVFSKRANRERNQWETTADGTGDFFVLVSPDISSQAYGRSGIALERFVRLLSLQKRLYDELYEHFHPV